MWKCLECGHENDEGNSVCTNCGATREEPDGGLYQGATESDFGGDPLWDDDQGLM